VQIAQRRRDDQRGHLSPHCLRAAVAECLLGRRVPLGDPAFVVDRDNAVQRRLQDGAVADLTLAEFFLGSLPLDELADLVAERGRRPEQFLVGASDVGAEELDHAQDLPTQLDRKGEGPVEPRLGGSRRPREVDVLDHVSDPGRFHAGPDATGQPDTRREAYLPAGGLERLGVDGGGLPDLTTAEHVLLGFHRPEDTQRPIEGFPDGLERLWSGAGEIGRLGQDAADGILHRETELCLFAPADVVKGDDRAPGGTFLEEGIRRVIGGETRPIAPPQDFVLEPAPLPMLERLEARALLLGVRRAVRTAVVDERVHIPADQLFRSVAEHPRSGAVDKRAAALQIDPIDALTGSLQERYLLPVLALHLLHLGLGFSGLGALLDLGHHQRRELAQEVDLLLVPGPGLTIHGAEGA
jgi:hypothetical protein